MTVESIAAFWSSTDLGQYVESRAMARGREEGREDAVAVVVAERFGEVDDAADLAHRLVTAHGLAGALRTVMSAQSVDDLRAAADATAG